MTQQNKIRIGITQGDVNGVGMEVIVKALANPDIKELFTPVIFGNEEILRQTVKDLNVEDFKFHVANTDEEIEDGEINLVPTGEASLQSTPGMASPQAGKASVDALEAAVKAIEEGDIDLLVTAPIDKNSVQSDKFRFPGHTEYLEERFKVEDGKALMILADDTLRVALVTTHLPVSKVAPSVTKESVESAIRAFNMALKMDFGCERPKIAVLALNPHCGDGGVLGKEESEEILPAIEECRRSGIMAFGPIAADGLFGSGSYRNYDGVLAMYHDQGLAPFKAIAGARGVNFTAGLNIIRTSPDHGTAYDKAGRGIADETSMREALYAAIDIARRRTNFLDASENPLEIRVQPQKKKPRVKQFAPEADGLEDLEDK